MNTAIDKAKNVEKKYALDQISNDPKNHKYPRTEISKKKKAKLRLNIIMVFINVFFRHLTFELWGRQKCS